MPCTLSELKSGAGRHSGCGSPSSLEAVHTLTHRQKPWVPPPPSRRLGGPGQICLQLLFFPSFQRCGSFHRHFGSSVSPLRSRSPCCPVPLAGLAMLRCWPAAWPASLLCWAAHVLGHG